MKHARLTVAVIASIFPVASARAQLPADNSPARVVVILADGSRLLGTLPAAAAFQVQSGGLQVPTPIKRIDSVTVSDDRKSTQVTLANGDRTTGSVPPTAFALTTLLGPVPLDMHLVKTLTVIPSAGDIGTDGLVLSNSLGSDADLAHSAVGPPVKPYTEAKNGYHHPGEHEFVSGEHGKAVTIKGTYPNDDWIHILELDDLDKLINPEEGTIEFWHMQTSPPVDWSYGVYRMFDGEAGLGACVGLFSARNTIFFNISCGGQSRGFSCPISVIPNNQWLHIAVVWDRKGIESSGDTMRLCINGTKVAASSANDWGTVPGGRADICGGQNANCAGKYLMSNLKVWKRAVPQSPPRGQTAWQPPAAAAPAPGAPAHTPPPFGKPAAPAGPTPPPFGRELPPN